MDFAEPSKSIGKNVDRNVHDKNTNIGFYTLILSILFIFSCLTGFFVAKEDKELAEKTIEQLFSQFGFVHELDPISIFLVIFLNNSAKALMAMLAGFLFGVFPAFFVALNGYLIGLVVYVKGTEIGFKTIALALIPHGILEIPAIIIACSYGVWLGKQFWMAINGKIVFRAAITFVLKKYLRIVLPILLIAALIETFITPYLVLNLNL